MDYEKLYKQALENAKRLYEQGTITESLAYIFPELKESEDEKIRGSIIDHLKDNNLIEWAAWLEKQESVREVVERCKNSWYNEGKIAGMAEGLTNDEKYQQGWHDALEKQCQTFTKKDVDDAYLKGICDTKHELEKQAEQKPTEEYNITGIGSKHAQGKLGEMIKRKLEMEKQGKQKPVLDFKASNWYVSKVDGKIHDLTYNPTDKMEPKFKTGEWVVFNNKHESVYQIEKIENFQYTLRHILGGSMPLSFSAEDMIRLWTIQDAKDGDVLIYPDGTLAVFKKLVDYGLYIAYAVQEPNLLRFDSTCTTLDCYPATKEQRDLLFQKMREASYEWNADKKELKKIEQKLTDKSDSIINILNNETREVQQKDLIKKPSLINLEKDNLSEVISVLDSGLMPSSLERARLIKGLQSIKLQQQHKLAWSEEDEKMYRMCVDAVEYYHTPEDESTIRNWLKSLKERNAWKPSKEQMDALLGIMVELGFNYIDYNTLESLYNDLKKL